MNLGVDVVDPGERNEMVLAGRIVIVLRQLDLAPTFHVVDGSHVHAVEAGGIGRDLDAVLSVDAIRIYIYKPRPEVYRLATEHFGGTPADVIFVSSRTAGT